jgi:hypothetical protein
MNRVAALWICLGLAGCVTASAQDDVKVGASFTLAPGTKAVLAGTTLGVRFVGIVEDSRCPRDTTCIWAGEVRAAFEILERAKVSKQAELKLGESADAGEHRVTLVGMEPQPLSTARISAQGYRATLRFDTAR